LQVVKSIIAAWYESRLIALSSGKIVAEGIESAKDAKSRLQEYLQKSGLDLPVYEIINIQGKDHEQIFTVKCTVKIKDGLGIKNIEIQGVGSTRKSAEQEAANLMCQGLQG
jgi:ribonuclease-3